MVTYIVCTAICSSLLLPFIGGHIIQDECTAHIKKTGEMFPGNIFVTTAGKLPAKFVIHAVGPNYLHGSQKEKHELNEAVYQSLQSADEKKCRSVAMPALGIGTLGYPVPMATDITINAIKDFIDEKRKHIHEVSLLSYPSESNVSQEFSKAAQQAFPTSTPKMLDQQYLDAAGTLHRILNSLPFLCS